jgi:hypothetical protein
MRELEVWLQEDPEVSGGVPLGTLMSRLARTRKRMQ